MSLPDGVPCTTLVNMTVDFFNCQPSLQEKLRKMREFLLGRNQVSVREQFIIYLYIYKENL